MEGGRQERWAGGALCSLGILKPWSRLAILGERHLPRHAWPTDRKSLQEAGFAQPPCPYAVYQVAEDGSSRLLV